LIKDKPEKTEAFKSKYHEMANNLIDDVLDGKRNIRRNKEGSTTITDLIEKPKETSRPKMSRRKVEIIRTPMPNDGAGDFSRVAFKPKILDKNTRPTMNILSYFKDLPNPQPKIPQFMPRGDNIDYAVNSFDGLEAVDGMPDDVNDGVNPEFDQPAPDEFIDDNVVEEVDDDVDDAVDDNMSIDVLTGDFKPDDNDELEDWADEEYEQPTSQIKAKPKPQTNDQNDEFESFFSKKKHRKTPKVAAADEYNEEDDYDLKSASPIQLPKIDEKYNGAKKDAKKDDKQYVCPSCGNSYTSKSSLTRHQKAKH
jgi:hypothetical protein